MAKSSNTNFFKPAKCTNRQLWIIGWVDDIEQGQKGVEVGCISWQESSKKSFRVNWRLTGRPWFLGSIFYSIDAEVYVDIMKRD
jgi:hypothetical protein